MQVIFCRNNRPLSFLIRAFTFSRWSHCGVVIDDHVIHATALNGVVIQPLIEVKQDYPSHEVCQLPGNAELALPLVGRKYDWGGVFGVRWGGWGDPDKWFCSELVAYCTCLFRENRVSRVTPEHCYMLSRS
ncbi:hypothetical protein [Shewanella sp.]|uniref:hypothetical protein n=1 Tax=Shewanella sp. TaxID=50422 RepID=UPI0035691A9C